MYIELYSYTYVEHCISVIIVYYCSIKVMQNE